MEIIIRDEEGIVIEITQSCPTCDFPTMPLNMDRTIFLCLNCPMMFRYD
jgi:hypothetical protein